MINYITKRYKAYLNNTQNAWHFGSLIKADFYRIFSKKSLYIYFGSLLILYILLVFITSSSLNADRMISQAENVFMFLAMLRRRLSVHNYL